MFRLIGNQPLSSSFLGFDRLFRDIDALLELASTQTTAFPPYNLYREDDGYSIELAVAGFKKEDITIERDRRLGTLTIKGGSQNDKKLTLSSRETAVTVASEQPERVLRQGIAKRSFTRVFNVADDIEVASAEVSDGLLTIRLKQTVKEDDYKPEVILIGN